MYCHNCGNQISDTAKFCPNCGEKNNLSVANDYDRSAIVKTEGEYNRDVLKQYLSDTRALECIKHKLENKLNDMDCRINNLAIQYKWNNRPRGSGIDEDSWYSFLFAGLALLAGWLLNYVGKWLFDSNIIFIIGLVIALIICAIGAIAISSDCSEQNARKEEWDRAKKQDDERLVREQAEKAELMAEREAVYEEYTELLTILENSYSVNIVPQQFRNLYAVYYLCEFIMTSNESFSNALLQCNLDEIKQQLATVIENQREIIVNQAVIIAQNEQIMEQNNKSLRHYAEIESNTARAAQYAQIAANNAEACAWIGVANYIKD